MKFQDITHNQQSRYILDTPGKHIFFCVNRSGKLVFDLVTPGAEALVYALFIGKNTDDFSFDVTQNHQAPNTTSRLLVKSVLSDKARFRYEGMIQIAKDAQRSDAEQINRNLILSSEASAFSRPDLEILADDVACRHASTTAKPNAEQFFYAQSRGLNQAATERLLMEGFINDFFIEIEKFGNFPELESYKAMHF